MMIVYFSGSSHSEKYEATMELFDEVKGDELKKWVHFVN